MIMGSFFNEFVTPILRNLRFGFWQTALQVAPYLMSMADSGGDSGPQQLDVNKLRGMQGKTQGLIDEQIGLGRNMMDPNSVINRQMRDMMAQRASETGAQTGSQALKIAAMKGVSPGQAIMQQRMAQNQASGSVNQNWINQLQQRFGQGLGVMGNMTQMQQGMDENLMNAYMANVQAQNQGQASGGGGAMQGLMGIASQFM